MPILESGEKDSPEVAISCDEPDPPPTKRMKGLAAVIQHVIDDLEENTLAAATLMPLQKIEKEISSYLEYPSLEADADPLAWWRLEKGRFPNLAYLAKNTCVYVVLAYHQKGFSVVLDTFQTVYEIVCCQKM